MALEINIIYGALIFMNIRNLWLRCWDEEVIEWFSMQ